MTTGLKVRKKPDGASGKKAMTIYVEPGLKQFLVKKAGKENRSLSKQIEHILSQYREKNK